jgi:hypothetical protein
LRADAREVPANRSSQGVWKYSTLMERHVAQNQSARDRWALDRVCSIESLHPSLQFSYHSRLILLNYAACLWCAMTSLQLSEKQPGPTKKRHRPVSFTSRTLMLHTLSHLASTPPFWDQCRGDNNVEENSCSQHYTYMLWNNSVNWCATCWGWGVRSLQGKPLSILPPFQIILIHKECIPQIVHIVAWLSVILAVDN